MTTSWKPITRGQPKVAGIHREHSGLLNVAIPLEPAAPPEWVQLFGHAGPFILSMHPPRATGYAISITPPLIDTLFSIDPSFVLIPTSWANTWNG